MAVGAWRVFVPCGHLGGGRESYHCGFLRDANFRTPPSGKKKKRKKRKREKEKKGLFIKNPFLRFFHLHGFTKMSFVSINPKCFVGSSQVGEIF